MLIHLDDNFPLVTPEHQGTSIQFVTTQNAAAACYPKHPLSYGPDLTPLVAGVLVEGLRRLDADALVDSILSDVPSFLFTLNMLLVMTGAAGSESSTVPTWSAASRATLRNIVATSLAQWTMDANGRVTLRSARVWQ